jgi:hypothetical protein
LKRSIIKLLLLLLFLVPKLAFGAVAYDTSGATGASLDHGTSLSFSLTLGASANLLVCSTTFGATVGLAVSSMSYDSVALTPHVSLDAVGGILEMWYLVSPHTGTAHTAAVTYSGDAERPVFNCSSFSGAASLGTAQTVDDLWSDVTCTVPTNGMCYDVGFAYLGNPGCVNPFPTGGTATQRFGHCEDQGPASSNELFSSTMPTTGVMNWLNSSGAWAGRITVPINPSGAAVPRHRVVVQ